MSDLWIPQEAPPGMEFLHLAWDPEAQWVACWLMAVTPARPCPTCGTLSDRVHTSYVRQPDELPVGDRRLRFFVVARRFWCDQPECDQQIFCERLEWVPADGRRTLALAQWIIDWALITSAEEAAETAARHGVVVSGDTILRRIRALPDPPQVAPKVVGIDDWALRKGHRYATVIVDLERRQIIDCLSDRSVETVTKWLKAHPSVEVVSRDRAEAYAKTSREGAPKAQPVADRAFTSWRILGTPSNDSFSDASRLWPPFNPRGPLKPVRRRRRRRPKRLPAIPFGPSAIPRFKPAGNVASPSATLPKTWPSIAKRSVNMRPPLPAPRRRLAVDVRRCWILISLSYRPYGSKVNGR